MANWALPTLTSTYTNFLTEVTGRDTDLAVGLDPAVTTVTNPPTNAIRWNSANNRWEKWNGTAWGTLSATYAFTSITATGNATVTGNLTVTGTTNLGNATAITPPTADNSTAVATTAYVKAQAAAGTASPTFTGTPTVPTAPVNTNTTQVANCAFVLGQAATVAPVMSGTAAVGTSTTFARADHVHPTDTTRAPLASPTFTGTPAAPTPAVDNNTTQLATTAFVIGQAASTAPLMDGTAAVGTSLRYARQDHRHPVDTSRAPTANPSFTGTATFAGDIVMTGTGYIDVPVGTTAQRPATPTAGMIRYNSETTEFEGYGLEWGPIGASVPPGAIIYVATVNPPAGYLRADGSAVSRTTYAKLFAAIGTTFGTGDGTTTFTLPDLRGVFIRGWDNGRGIDTGRGFGTTQSGDIQSHAHPYGFAQGSNGAINNGYIGISGVTNTGSVAELEQSGGNDGQRLNAFYALTAYTGGSETRPINAALLACIKF